MKVAFMDLSDDRLKEDVGKWTIGSESYHSVISNSKIRLINFVIYKDSAKSTMYFHNNINRHNGILTSKFTNQLSQILISSRHMTNVQNYPTVRI